MTGPKCVNRFSESSRPDRSGRRRRMRRGGWVLSTAAVAALLATQSGVADVKTWDGEQGNAILSAANNWVGDVAPVSGDSLVFSGGYGAFSTTIVNSYPANTEFAGITFSTNAGPFTIGQAANPVVNLTGNISHESVLPQTINNPLALTATRTVNVTNLRGTLTLGGVLSETAAGFGLTKTGSGLTTLTNGGNNFTGPITITGGTLAYSADSIGTANQLGNGSATAASITLDGGTLRSTAAVQLSTNRSLVLGANGGTFDQSGNNTSTYNGVISGGANTFTKTGQGVLVLGGISTYTGATTVNQGTLRLDFAQLGASVTNILDATGTLTLGGGASGLNSTTSTTTAGQTFDVRSKGTPTDVSQSLAGVTFARGINTISTSQTGATGNVLLDLGGLTHRAGGFVNFVPVGVSGPANAITTTASNDGSDAGGILGGWASVAGGGYAARDIAGNVVTYTGYTPLPAGPITSTVATNGQIQTTATALSTANGVTTELNTLSLSSAATGINIVTIGAAGPASTGTLRLGAKGGLMLNAGSGALTIGNVVGNGTLTAGAADNTPGEINVLGFAGLTAINSVISDNGTGTVSLSVGQYTDPAGDTAVNINSTVNTYSGGTIIASARVTSNTGALTPATNNAAFGTGSVTVMNGAQAFLAGQGVYANAFNIAGNGTNFADTTSAIRFTGNATISGTVTLLGDSVIALRNSVNNAITGRITGNYNLTILQNGGSAGNITLSNTANDYAGHLFINDQRVILGASNVLSNGAGVGNVILGNSTSAVLDLNGFNETINGLDGNNANPFVQNGLNDSTSMLTVGDGDASAVFTGIIRNNNGVGSPTGVVALTKIGAGTQLLRGNNTHSGGTTVKGGVLFRDTNATAFGTGTLTLGDTAAGTTPATVRVSNNGTNFANAITVEGGNAGTKTIETVGAGQVFTFSGPVILNDTLTIGILPAGDNDLAFSGAIAGNGGIVAANRFVGTTALLTLSGAAANTYLGTTTVTAGTLDLAKTAAVAVSGNLTIGDGTGTDVVRLGGTGDNQIADTATVTFNGTGANAGVLRLNTRAETIGGLSSTGGAGVVENNGTAARTLTVNVASGSRSFTGILQNGGSNALRLTKTGAGVQSLSGASTYTGATSVEGGTLEGNADGAFNNSASGGNVSVLGTAVTLTIGPIVTDAISDAASLSLEGGGIADLADFGYLTLAGNETVGSLTLAGFLQATGTYGSLASLATNKSDEFFSGSGVLTVVPEPASLGMATIGMLALIGRRRRR